MEVHSSILDMYSSRPFFSIMIVSEVMPSCFSECISVCGSFSFEYILLIPFNMSSRGMCMS